MIIGHLSVLYKNHTLVVVSKHSTNVFTLNRIALDSTSINARFKVNKKNIPILTIYTKMYYKYSKDLEINT